MLPVLYPFLFGLILLGWPWASVGTDPIRVTAIKVIVDYGILALVWYRTSSPTLGFWSGLARVSMSMRTGCANFTIAIVLPICCALYVAAIVFTLIGLFAGKTWTETMWAHITAGFGFGFDSDDPIDDGTVVHEASPPRFSSQTDVQRQSTGPSAEFLRSLGTVGIDERGASGENGGAHMKSEEQ